MAWSGWADGGIMQHLKSHSRANTLDCRIGENSTSTGNLRRNRSPETKPLESSSGFEFKSDVYRKWFDNSFALLFLEDFARTRENPLNGILLAHSCHKFPPPPTSAVLRRTFKYFIILFVCASRRNRIDNDFMRITFYCAFFFFTHPYIHETWQCKCRSSEKTKSPVLRMFLFCFFDQLDSGRRTGKRAVKAAALSPRKISDPEGEKKMKFEVLWGLPMSQFRSPQKRDHLHTKLCGIPVSYFLFQTSDAKGSSHIILHVLNQRVQVALTRVETSERSKTKKKRKPGKLVNKNYKK